METVAEVNDLIRRALKYYPNIKHEEINVYLIEYADRILPTFPADLAEYATKRLRMHGIDVKTGVGTKSATSTAVELGDGSLIPTRTIVATIGNGPNPLVASLDLDMQWGRVKTDRFMRVSGRDGIWAVGDAALIPLVEQPADDPLHYAPQTAQFAVREGRQLAQNLIAKAKGEELKPFAYTSRGSLASLGMSKAVAEVYGIKLSGFLAWLLWRGFYLSFLPGFATKVRVLVNWILNAFVPPNIVLVQSSMPGTRYIHYRTGDKVLEPGMLIDGFYTVVKGALKLTIDNPETGEHFENVFGPGDHLASACWSNLRSAPASWWRSRIRSSCGSRSATSRGWHAPSRTWRRISRITSRRPSAAQTWSLPPAAPSAATSSNARIEVRVTPAKAGAQRAERHEKAGYRLSPV